MVPVLAGLLCSVGACEATNPRDDASPPDVVGVDASSPDASSPDASSPDASSLDASSLDASSLDASSSDASSLDASSPDASSLDASSPDVWGSETDGVAMITDAPETGVLDGHSTDAPTPGRANDLFAACGGTCSVRGGMLRCWGAVGPRAVTSDPSIPTPDGLTVPGISDAVQVSFQPDSHACAVRATGAVVCWGSNDHGQLGDGTMAASATPVSVVGLTDAVEVSVGHGFSYARRRGGELVRWGIEDPYRPSGPSYPTPVAFAGITGATQVVTNNDSACALQSDGDAFCWGNRYAFTGVPGGDRSPLRVGTGVRRLSFNPTFLCMAHADHVVCQGPSVMMNRFFPAMVPLAGVTQLATISVGIGGLGFYARRDDGTVCWVGPDSPVLTYPEMPSAIPGLGTVTDITGRCQHVCVRLASGVARCWGSNNSGELGDRGASAAREVTHTTPVTVVVE